MCNVASLKRHRQGETPSACHDMLCSKEQEGLEAEALRSCSA